MPSRPMFTTPERSETTPPSAPKTSGVANRSIAAASADHTTTLSRRASPDCVAATAPIAPTTPATIAPQPRRALPSRTAQPPSPTAPTAIAIDGPPGEARPAVAPRPSARPARADGDVDRRDRGAAQQRRRPRPPREDAARHAAPAAPHRTVGRAGVDGPAERRGGQAAFSSAAA